jgi:hypothetical protein
LCIIKPIKEIDAPVLGLLEERCKSKNITNIKTVLGSEDDPFYPTDDLDMEPRIDRIIQIGG